MNIPEMDSNEVTTDSLTDNHGNGQLPMIQSSTDTTTRRFLHTRTGSELWRTALRAISSLKAEHTKSSMDVDDIHLAVDPLEQIDHHDPKEMNPSPSSGDYPYKKLSLAVRAPSSGTAYLTYTDSPIYTNSSTRMGRLSGGR